MLVRIVGLNTKNYSERLRVCGLEPPQLRRIKRDLVLVLKFVKNFVDLKFEEEESFTGRHKKEDYFTFAVARGLRGNSKKLYPKYARVNVVLNSFNYRVVNAWNSLPEYVVVSNSLSVVKAI